MFSPLLIRFSMQLFSFALITWLGLMLTGQVTAQTAAFTFQGRLTDSSLTANGIYEMQFSLYDTLSGGTQVGTTITNSSVTVTNGVFTVQLDFSPATPFVNGSDRWIELAVRKAADPPGYTTLAPRQQITSAPYATTAGNVTGVVGVASGGTGSSSGDASALTNINPANISPGTALINVQGIAANPLVVTSGTTPSAAARTMLVFDYVSASVFTDLTGGIDGQCVVLLTLNDNVSIANGGNFRLSGDWIPTDDSTLTVCRSSASGSPRWYETARSANVSQVALTTSTAGTGSGTINSSPGGIICPGDCTEAYDIGTVVTLTAAADGGSNFTGWSGGGCSGTGTCVVTMNSATSVIATFALDQFTLSVNKIGTGSGTVTSSPGGINCGADCTESYNNGTVVALSASAAGGSNFAGWSGACTGTGSCVVTMTVARNVTALFTLQQLMLTTVRAGTGTGTITSSPAGINCGADCTEPYDIGTSVTLTAAAAGGSSFTGWSGGGCSGTGSCVVTLNAPTTVTATFTLQQFTLSTSRAGTGTGTITSSPAGINCGADCTESYNSGTVVTLTASPAGGSTFAGWSGGGCTGTGTCVVTITAATSVTATFNLQQFTLTVNRAGAGTGTITSSPAGINCGADCSEAYNHGTMVTLTATPSGGTFAGWSGGGCSGTGTCVVTITAATTVTATFNP